jgi:hypothetical protein
MVFVLGNLIDACTGATSGLGVSADVGRLQMFVVLPGSTVSAAWSSWPTKGVDKKSSNEKMEPDAIVRINIRCSGAPGVHVGL